MSRRLDWDRAKVRLGERIYEVTDEVPTVVGPAETGRRYLSAVVEAVLKGRSLPKPSHTFLRYYGQFPDWSVESWLQKQPRYLAALKRREAKEAAAAQKVDNRSQNRRLHAQSDQSLPRNLQRRRAQRTWRKRSYGS